MSVAKSGDAVQVHYRGTLDDGSEFDSSAGGGPLRFSLGEGNVIPGFEQAVVGMRIGERKTVRIVAGEAYGERQEGLVMRVPRDQFPMDIDAEIGAQLIVGQVDGSELPVVISDVSLDAVTLDANHPLAGHDLTFEIQLVAIGN
jgi:peptidylprolyl isomerase